MQPSRPSTKKLYTVMAMRHGGTHLILPLVKQITGKALYRPKGEEALTCVPNGPVIVFLRDPRNRLVSALRWKTGRMPSDAEMARYMVAVKDGEKRLPLNFMLAWARRWTKHDGALQVRFEELAGARGIEECERINAFVKKDADCAAIYRRVFGARTDPGTFTGQHSDWRKVFGEASSKVWAAHGGPEILERMGYE